MSTTKQDLINIIADMPFERLIVFTREWTEYNNKTYSEDSILRVIPTMKLLQSLREFCKANRNPDNPY